MKEENNMRVIFKSIKKFGFLLDDVILPTFRKAVFVCSNCGKIKKVDIKSDTSNSKQQRGSS